MKSIKTENILIGVILLIFIGMGGVIGYSVSFYFGDNLPWWAIILRIVEGMLLLFIAIFLQLILHEAGHMTAALIRGWKFISFMALGWILTRRNGHFHLSRFNIAGAGGQCLMQPPAQGDTSLGIAFYNAGGVLMNIVVSLISGIFLILNYRTISWDLAILLMLLFFSGLVFALINGIPVVMGGLPNDGKNIQQLHKDPFSTKTFITTMRFISRMQQGETIDQVAPDYLCDGQKMDYKNPIHQMALSFDISLAISKLDFNKAQTLLAEIDAHQAEIADLYLKELTFEKVYLYLVAPRDNIQVKDFLSDDFIQYMNAQCAFRPTALRTKYTYTLLYEHNKAEAEKLYGQFYKVCNKYHIPGEVETEKKLVEYATALDL